MDVTALVTKVAIGRPATRVENARWPGRRCRTTFPISSASTGQRRRAGLLGCCAGPTQEPEHSLERDKRRRPVRILRRMAFAAAAAQNAGIDADLLADFLPALVAAVAAGNRLGGPEDALLALAGDGQQWTRASPRPAGPARRARRAGPGEQRLGVGPVAAAAAGHRDVERFPRDRGVGQHVVTLAGADAIRAHTAAATAAGRPAQRRLIAGLLPEATGGLTDPQLLTALRQRYALIEARADAVLDPTSPATPPGSEARRTRPPIRSDGGPPPGWSPRTGTGGTSPTHPPWVGPRTGPRRFPAHRPPPRLRRDHRAAATNDRPGTTGRAAVPAVARAGGGCNSPGRGGTTPVAAPVSTEHAFASQRCQDTHGKCANQASDLRAPGGIRTPTF